MIDYPCGTLTLDHEQGLIDAARDGELWNYILNTEWPTVQSHLTF